MQDLVEIKEKDVKELFYLRDCFMSLAEQIAIRYSAGIISKQKVVNILMRHVCEKHILERISNFSQGKSDRFFDRIWRNLHKYAVVLFLERLKNELASKKIKVAIVSESVASSGRYDVIVINSRIIRIVGTSIERRISIEFKIGLNIEFTQLEKYLWNDLTLVLVRVETGHVVRLKTSDWIAFLKCSLKDRISKAERVLEGKVMLVPGEDCFGCPLSSCKFNRSKTHVNGLRKPNNLESLLENFKKNLYPSIEKAVKITLDEIMDA
jgi:hypothetical protein